MFLSILFSAFAADVVTFTSAVPYFFVFSFSDQILHPTYYFGSSEEKKARETDNRVCTQFKEQVDRWAASKEYCPLFCLLAGLFVCWNTRFLACLLSFFLACLLPSLLCFACFACLLALLCFCFCFALLCLLARLLACLLCLLACLRTCSIARLLPRSLACLPTCSIACFLPSFLPSPLASLALCFFECQIFCLEGAASPPKPPSVSALDCTSVSSFLP